MYDIRRDARSKLACMPYTLDSVHEHERHSPSGFGKGGGERGDVDGADDDATSLATTSTSNNDPINPIGDGCPFIFSSIRRVWKDCSTGILDATSPVCHRRRLGCRTHDAVAVGHPSATRKKELGLTDSQRECEREQKRLSVSLNKAMRTHRGAHVRKLAEIQKNSIHPHSRNPVV